MKTFIIIGCHRSGTSLTSMLANKIGVYIGDKLIGPTHYNKYGHFENIEFMRLHEKWLKELHSSWHDPPSIESIKEHIPKFKNEAIEYVNKFKREPLWGWKDPRNTIFLPVYLEIVENPHVIICLRDSISIAKSLSKRDKFTFEYSKSVVKKYMEHLEYCKKLIKSNKIPNIEIKFENYFNDGKNEIRKLMKFILGTISEQKVEFLTKLIDPNAKHF